MPARRLNLVYVTPLAILLGSCSGSDSTSLTDRGIQIEVSSGDQQDGTVGADLALPVQVRVTNLLDDPISGQVVNFVVQAGGGTVTRTAFTNASGLASGTWQLGTVAGSTQQLEARTSAPNGSKLVVLFTANATADVPDTISAVSAVQLSAAAGTAVRTIPSVRLADRFGNPVPNHPVSFAVTSGGGSVQGGAASSDASGIATVLAWTLGSVQGANQLTATVAGLAAIPFNATATSPIATHVGLAVEPAAIAQSGIVLTRQPVAQLLNDSEDPIPTAGVQVTASVVSGSGILLGTSQLATDANGAATYTNLAIGGTVGTFTLGFAAPALASDTSALIGLAAGTPTTFTNTSGLTVSANAGTTIPAAPSATVLDDWGNGVSGITVTFVVDSGGGSVTGGTQITDADGIATVGSWTLGPLAGTNTLIVTANRSGLSGNPHTITADGLGDFWRLVSTMFVPRRYTAFAGGNGLLYTAGGKDEGLAVVPTVEVYIPSLDLWTPRAPMATARVGAAGGYINGKFYVAGGTAGNGHALATAEAFSPSNTWAPIASMPAPRNFSAFGVLHDKLILAGGGDDNGQLSTVVRYDPVTNAWDTLASLPTIRNDAIGVPLNGLFYVVGGKIDNTTDGGLLVYDPQANSWTALAPMPTPRFHTQAVAINGKIYVVSGLEPGGGHSAVTEVYDPATDTWSTGADFPSPRNAAAAVVLDGLLYIAGGDLSVDEITGTTYVYVPHAD